MDVAAKADDIGKAKISEIGEQLVVAEAAIGQDGHPAAGRDDLRQAAADRHPRCRCADPSIRLSTPTATAAASPGHGRSPDSAPALPGRRRRSRSSPWRRRCRCAIPTRCGTQRAKLSQTSMPLLLSRRSTCLIACLVTRPRACASAWPIIATASEAPVMTPSVAAASESTRLAWRSRPYRLSMNARMSFSRPPSRSSAAVHSHDAHSSTKSPDLVGNRRESAQDLGGRKIPRRKEMRGVVSA